MRVICLFILFLSLFVDAQELRYKQCANISHPKFNKKIGEEIAKASLDWLIDNLNILYPNEYENGWGNKLESNVIQLSADESITKFQVKICFIQKSKDDERGRGKKLMKIVAGILSKQTAIILAKKT
jgi:hypothetical protein